MRAAANGDSALAALASPDVGLLITELYVPCSRGRCVAASVRNDPAFADVLVVAYSTFSQEYGVQRARRIRVSSYFAKPTPPLALLAVAHGLVTSGGAPGTGENPISHVETR